MCRLIMAVGRFRAAAVLDAAVAMSAGRTADHDGRISVHPNGWGAVWQAPDGGGLAVHRDVRPLFESVYDSPVAGLETAFLAVHSRHATLPKNHGLEFTHPLERPGDVPWYFMHNGFLPTVHRNLGLTESRFDSLEYFDYIVPPGALRLDREETMARLRAIPPCGSSGNAIAVTPRRAHVIHWSSADVAAPRYFSMYRLDTADCTIVSSEVIPDLAAPARWSAVERDTVLEFPLAGPGAPHRIREGENHVHV